MGPLRAMFKPDTTIRCGTRATNVVGRHRLESDQQQKEKRTHDICIIGGFTFKRQWPLVVFYYRHIANRQLRTQGSGIPCRFCLQSAALILLGLFRRPTFKVVVAKEVGQYIAKMVWDTRLIM